MQSADTDMQDTLRFITCGSVDDGKSTLLGHLLFKTNAIPLDQLEDLRKDSTKFGTQGENIDYALLMDGLSAEREQGITIDVSYRFFATQKRHFIAADTPGHEQYTRNMVTGASNADAAIVLIDATKGILAQTKRHSFILSLMRVRHIVLAVNKMDQVAYDEAVFDRICENYARIAQNLDFASVTAIPLSALKGDNIIELSKRMPWYHGPTLLGTLESLPVSYTSSLPFRMPVQWVNRPDAQFRGFAGRVVSGTIAKGDEVTIYPSGEKAHIKEIILYKDMLETATSGQSVTMTLNREIDLSRGDVILAGAACEINDQFEASIVWVDTNKGTSGQRYLLKSIAGTTNAVITKINFVHDIQTSEQLPANNLEKNDIALVKISTDRKIVFDSYQHIAQMGSFILIDRQTNATVAVGMINFALHHTENLFAQNLSVKREHREQLNGHRAFCLWLTGLSGSGKSTLANAVEMKLHEKGVRTYILDGDNVRQGLNRDLGFNDEDRVENIRRVAEVARLLVDAGLVVIVSFISPFRAERGLAKSLFDDESFKEIFVHAPLEVVEARDTKGLYKRARAGLIPNFTGISSPYEAPENPDLVVNTHEESIEATVQRVLSALKF